MLRFCDIGNHIVFSDGRIWSKYYKRFLKGYIENKRGGYEYVGIDDRYICRLHQIVTMCFLDNWSSDLDVDHIDRDKTNNCAET